MEELKENEIMIEGRKCMESPIFVSSVIPTDEEMDYVQNLVNIMPVAVFRALNKRLNWTGFCINIKVLPKDGDAEESKTKTEIEI